MNECKQFAKGSRQRAICEGRADLSAKKINAFRALHGLTPLLPEEVEEVQKPKHSRGLGDKVSAVIKKVTGIKPCGGCGRRAAKLNHWFPNKDLPPIEPVEWTEPVTKNLIYHLWPVSGYGAWQWNLDRLLKSIDLFNGKRIMAIAESAETDSADAVKDYLSGHNFEFIVVKNSAKLREVLTWVPMLERIESDNPNEVTFSGHGKCVRHKIGADNTGTTIFNWTSAMYETVLENWDAAKEALKTHGMAGSFKRYGQFKTKGNYRWHYSGTFFWFRNRDVFQRNWRYTDQKFFGTESWPGHMFKPEETACLFMDEADDLYKKTYWDNEVQPKLEDWRNGCN